MKIRFVLALAAFLFAALFANAQTVTSAFYYSSSANSILGQSVTATLTPSENVTFSGTVNDGVFAFKVTDHNQGLVFNLLIHSGNNSQFGIGEHSSINIHGSSDTTSNAAWLVVTDTSGNILRSAEVLSGTYNLLEFNYNVDTGVVSNVAVDFKLFENSSNLNGSQWLNSSLRLNSSLPLNTSAIPEPATYCQIAGLAVFVIVAVWRLRRQFVTPV